MDHQGTDTIGQVQAQPRIRAGATTKVCNPGTTAYTESDLVRVAGSLAPNGGPHLSHHWLGAETADELRRRIHEALEGLGFDWLSHRSVAFLGGMLVDRRLLASHAHPDWLRLYREGAPDEMASHTHPGGPSTLPLVWSVDDADAWRSDERLTPAQLWCPRFLRGCGIESGVVITLPRRCSAEHTVCELFSTKPGHTWINADVLSRSVMFAWCLHELLTVHMSLDEKADRNKIISPTRRKILRCLVNGRSNKQIAHELQISSDTVKYHLRELQRHLNIRNRVQLVNLIASNNEP
jgi:DNA-binding CsgD family transcriptional regulator